MIKTKIIDLFKDHENNVHVQTFANYCVRLKFEKNKQGQLKNPWFQKKTEENMAELFWKVNAEGLVFDGKHVTLQSTGISYDYKAYRNKMLNVYPESKIDISLVYEGDTTDFWKESGKVHYKHAIGDPSKQTDDKIKFGYIIIKNDRGEFLTTLTKQDFEKHRKVAKQDYIWIAWYVEMCKKTLIKKACSDHFDDIYTGINEMDNENIDLEKSVNIEKTDIDLKHQELIDALDIYPGEDKGTIQELCAGKALSKELTIEFMDGILNQIK